MTKSQGMIEIDELVEKYQLTKNQELADQLYNRLKWYFHKYGHEEHQISDAQYAFARAIDTWEKESNVWFIVWFNRLWMQHRREANEYWQKKKRTGYKIVPIDATYGDNENGMTVSEMIPDERIQPELKRIQNEKIFTEFLERDDITEREKMILKNIYFSEGKFQTQIAKDIGVSQPIVHKTLKRMKNRPFAEDLYKLIKDMMSHD